MRKLSIAVFAIMILASYAAADAAPLSVFTDGTSVVVSDGEHHLLTFGPMFWGPGWKFGGVEGRFQREGDAALLRSESKIRGSGLPYVYTTRATLDGRELTLQFTFDAERAGEAQLVAVGITPGDPLSGEEAALVQKADGTEQRVALPFGTAPFGEVQNIVVGRGDQATPIAVEPAWNVQADRGAARVILAGQDVPAEPIEVTLKVMLPQDAELYATPDEVPMPENWDNWFAWQADSDATEPSAIDMSGWLEAPAGKHGRVSSDGQKLVYNGRPIRFWGLNNAYSACAPPKELADKRAEFYSKYGVNAVRLHKLADGPRWAGIQSLRSAVEFDPEKLDQLDYYVAQLKKKGIYVKFSVALGWGMRLGPDDKKYVPYIEEFGEFGDSPAPRVNPGHGAIYWSPEVQTAKILQLTNLLEHENPYTGMTYAEDPAVMLVEMTNEESIYWYSTMGTMLKHPHLRKYAATEFTRWLRKKYGSEEKLLEAWGENSLNVFVHEEVTDESFEDNSIVPVGNAWFFDPANLETSQLERKPRLLDTMEFMYDMQNRFYDRFMDAIRESGYEGMVETSNWQAGRAMSHYLNLHSDARIGLVDRHNYYGNRPSMLRVPGSGTLSSGLQQVADRPFSISEWIHVFPNDRGVEGPAIIGAYGLGLQGWDVSFMFQNGDDGEFSGRIGRQRWDVVAPQVMGAFPAVSRQVLRGDVKTAEKTAELKVHVPSLMRGELDFTDMVEQQHDIKVLNTDKVPARALAVARTVVEFTEEPEPTEEFPIEQYTEDGTLVSTTGQLRWTPMGALPEHPGEGFFTMDTPGTQALVGYAEGRSAEFGQVTITSHSPFAAIYVSAAERSENLADGGRWIVTTMARARNEGMVYLGRTLLRRGSSPIRMEPVKTTLKLKRDGAKVHVLDHDGRRTGRTVPVDGDTVVLDGAETRTVYYEITFE